MAAASNSGSNMDSAVSKEVKSAIPKNRQDVLKWYGWGYKNVKFIYKNGSIAFDGDQYSLSGYMLPLFTKWVEDTFDMKLSDVERYPNFPEHYPEPQKNSLFLKSLEATAISFTDKGEDRLIRCHGQTLHDIYQLWENAFERIPDLVIWPNCHNDVESIVKLANEHNIVLIPYGGGTSVSGSITCPQNETRMIAVVDTSQMNKMLWLDRTNLTVCFESGIVGQDLERELQKVGLTVGHEPDSYEFSTLGGWVATRASGMKKNVYGNIEDIVVRVRMATTKGVLERECSAPRVSCGPDLNHMILGSEGTLGIVTEVVLKVRPLPAVKRYGSLLFPDFESGVKFMREVAKRRCQPSSVRFMDNEQFRFGQCLKPIGSWYTSAIDRVKQTYVTLIKGYDLNKACAATLLFEGEKEDIERQENAIYEIAKKYRGFPAGGTNGERGYILTFVIAYIRDFGLNHQIVAESFETSVPWDRCALLCRNVKQKVKTECEARHIKNCLISCRVTQTYDAGCCVYFYFGFKYVGIQDPVGTYESIENAAREEILVCGGSLSHHHGVGKIRSKWYPRTVSEVGVGLYRAAKMELDPKNIFAAGNLLPSHDDHHKAKL